MNKRIPDLSWRIATLLLVTAAVFSNALSNPFVYDDEPAIVDNPSIREFQTALSPPSNTPVAGRPVVNLSLAASYAMNGYDEFGYHVFNLAVHMANAVVLMLLLRTVVSASAAHLTAMLWTVHPLQTECINYVIQRTELLMVLFMLLTVYAAVRASQSTHRPAWSAVAVIACALGTLCKESMVTAPLVVGMWLWFWHRAAIRRQRGLLAALTATWLILAAVLWTGPRPDVGFGVEVSPWQYLLNQAVMICRYLRLAVCPYPLLIDYGKPAVLTLSQVWPYGLVIVALLIGAGVLWRRHRGAGFAALTFFILLAPTSSFVPIASEVGAERRMYLPLAALIALIVIPLARRRAGVVVMLAVAGVLAGMTWQRNAQYRDPILLWRQVVTHDPDNGRARNNLANLYKAHGKPQKALSHLRRAAEIDPEVPEIHNNLASALLELDRPADALAPLQRALKLRPKYGSALINAGNAFYLMNQHDKAIAFYRRAIEVEPDNMMVKTQLGMVLAEAGRLPQAEALLKQVLSAQPDHAEAWFHLAVTHLRLKRVDDAISAFETAARLAPDHAVTRHNLGIALMRGNRTGEAIVQLRKAVALDPGYESARRALTQAIKEHNMTQ